MDKNQDLVVYTLESCPNCELLKEYLAGHGYTFREEDMSSARALTELRVNGVFVNEAPVLQSDTIFLTSRDLFSRGSIRTDRLSEVLKGVRP